MPNVSCRCTVRYLTFVSGAGYRTEQIPLTLNRYGDFIEEPTITARSIGLLDPPCVMRSKGYTPVPVSMMSQWWVTRSSSAVVIFLSLKTWSHSLKARLVVTKEGVWVQPRSRLLGQPRRSLFDQSPTIHLNSRINQYKDNLERERQKLANQGGSKFDADHGSDLDAGLHTRMPTSRTVLQTTRF